MRVFDAAVEMVLRFEGPETDDPSDPGRRTKFGISIKAHPEIDLDTLTREQAIDVYRKQYWEPIEGELLPPVVAMLVFDAAVNMGIKTAVRLLQREVGVEPDGVMGPQTIAAVASRIHDDVAVRITARRAVAYAQMPKGLFERYGFGWMSRVVDAYRTAILQG